MTKITELICNTDRKELEKDKYFYTKNTDDRSQEEHVTFYQSLANE